MTENKERIGLASDHAGFAMKEYVKHLLETRGYDVLDFGTHSEASCDYPDFAHALAEAIERGQVGRGIGVCGSQVAIWTKPPPKPALTSFLAQPSKAAGTFAE